MFICIKVNALITYITSIFQITSVIGQYVKKTTNFELFCRQLDLQLQLDCNCKSRLRVPYHFDTYKSYKGLRSYCNDENTIILLIDSLLFTLVLILIKTLFFYSAYCRN